MKTITLSRINHNKPDFKEFDRMQFKLEQFLKQDVNPTDSEWMENLQTIIDFQDVNGSFRLVDSYDIPMDARVDFCHIPTYTCTAILMKAFMTDEDILGNEGKEVFKRALQMCCEITIHGRGIEFFRQAGISEFVMNHRELCPKFCRIMKREVSTYTVFVYGTLLKDEANHNYYLQDTSYLGKATISGYDMYNIGAFPGIVPGEGTIPGELYEVDDDTMERLDYLEGEGSLYIRESAQVTTSTGEKTFASIYVYNQSVEGLKKIPAWKQEDYVWYVSYGSNMLRERFMHYIEGGSYEGGGACHDPCEDTTQPLAVKTYDIPYDMYFGNSSGSWEGGGVSFLDITKPGSAKGVAYLITREQFEHVACQENGGCLPEYSVNWYNTITALGYMDGCEVITITNDSIRPYNEPAEAYLDTLRRGLRENYPEMTEKGIERYLDQDHF